MNLSDQINLADPILRRALHETGKWSRIIALISGILLALVALAGVGAALFAPEFLNDAFLNNPMLSSTSPIYLGVMYIAAILLGIFVALKLFQFGKILKGNGPMHPLANTEINTAFGHLVVIFKYYAVFSVVSLVGSLVMLVL